MSRTFQEHHHHTSNCNCAANSSCIAVKFKTEHYLVLINAFLYRKRACKGVRRAFQGRIDTTRRSLPWHTTSYSPRPPSWPTAPKRCACIPSEAIAYAREPASRLDPYTRRSWPCTDARLDPYVREPHPPSRWLGHRRWKTLVRRLPTAESMYPNASNTTYRCSSG